MTTLLRFPKPVRLRDPQYLAWIRRQPCLVCRGIAQPHHTTAGGWGTKGSDYRCVPLCHRHHRELHDIGAQSFEERHRVDLREQVIRLLETYMSAMKEEE